MQSEKALPAGNHEAGKERLRQFIAAWKQEFGEELSEGEARIRLHELVEFYLLLAKPLPENPTAGGISGGDEKGN